jgi:hypothetical protein
MCRGNYSATCDGILPSPPTDNAKADHAGQDKVLRELFKVASIKLNRGDLGRHGSVRVGYGVWTATACMHSDLTLGMGRPCPHTKLGPRPLIVLLEYDYRKGVPPREERVTVLVMWGK